MKFFVGQYIRGKVRDFTVQTINYVNPFQKVVFEKIAKNCLNIKKILNIGISKISQYWYSHFVRNKLTNSFKILTEIALVEILFFSSFG